MTNLKHSPMRVTAGTIVFRDGDPRQFLYIVQKGQVAIFKMTAQKERIPLGIIGSGEYLGEGGLLDNKSHHATWAVALTDTELIQIPVEAINEQIKHIPPWMVSMTKGLSQKLRRMNDIVHRNKLSDEALDKAMLAVQESEKKRKGSS